MLKIRQHSIIAFIFCTMIVSSCKERENDVATLNIALGQTTVSAGASRQTMTIETNSKQTWTATVESNGSWCVVTPSSGTGSAFVSVNVAENTPDITRTATITITIDKTSQSVNLTQRGVPNGIEIPEIKNRRWCIQHQYYALEFDTAQRHSIWVAYVFNNHYNLNNVTRPNPDPWIYDPQIPREFQWAYPHNPDAPGAGNFPTLPGYDRGHLIASADRLFNSAANLETFHISNASPQVGRYFNQHIWESLESLVRRWARASDCDTLYVVTGGAINPGVETLGRIGSRNNVTIPKYYYKALVKRKGNDFTGIAWWFENKQHSSTTVTNYSYAMTIRELEQKTGINFFPNLKYALPGNPNLEEDVETTMNTARWPL
ncbi:MAG: DNA/RNA non-specific endonuclease [Bacteroidales bacterium]|nr:DNA/RNA non-specific endonuclease [Bacteroidales bacterium]